MVKLYTKTGDGGSTSLYDVAKISKGDFTLEPIGDLDELSASLGLICSKLEADEPLYSQLRCIQGILLRIGANLATVRRRKGVKSIESEDVSALEKYIDKYTEACPELKEFILVGAGEIDSLLHISRAICRRTERHLVKLTEELRYLDSETHLFEYINRLSDYFFAAARFYSYKQGKKEEIWKG